MGRIKKGILGGFNGTIGTVVGGSWKGIDYMRSQPVISNSTPSPAQVAQRARFGLATKFISPITDLVSVGFQDFAVEMSGFNSAVSYTLDNAVMGSYPNFTISYPDVLVTRGRLKNGKSPVASATVADKVNFAWTDNTGRPKATATDKTILVVHCPDLDETDYVLGGAVRTAGADLIDVTEFKGKIVHTWMAFISADGKSVSDSFYTGQLTVL